MRRRVPLTLVAVALAATAALITPAGPANAAHRDTSGSSPSVEVFADNGGIVSDGADLHLSVVIADPGTQAVAAGQVELSVTSGAITTSTALAAFQQDPSQEPQRSLASSATSAVAAGSSELVAFVTIPAATLALPSTAPGVFGIVANVTTPDGVLGSGAGTVVVPGATPTTVGVAAVMPITVQAGGDGLISSQELTTYTGPEGLLTRELAIAQRDPGLTIGIDPMILASIRVLGSSAPASAQSWLTSLAHLPNPSFALQYGDADPALQTQAGLSAPLQPTDFGYAMSAGDFNTPLTIGEPTPTTAPTPSPTPTTTANSKLPTLSELLGFPYTLTGIAWPAPGTISSSDLSVYSGAGLTTTIVSASNTNADKLTDAPDALLNTQGGTALVTDDALSAALQAAATATDPSVAAVASATLNAQLALTSDNAPSGSVVLASLGRTWPSDASRASTAVTAVFDSPFSHPASIQDALASTPSQGLELVDQHNTSDRLQQAATLLDLAGEPRKGGSPAAENIAAFSSVLVTPALLTGDVRARLLELFSVGWVGSGDWDTAVAKQLSSMNQTLDSVQIVSPGSIRQASRQALIPITVMNKLDHPIEVVLSATSTSARLEVEPHTAKTISAGSSAKVLVPVKAQLSNGTVYLHLQLYSSAGVGIGTLHRAEVDVRADWEGIGAVIFGLLVVALFSFGLLRTIQRRRREKGGNPEVTAATDAEKEPRG